MIIIYALIDPRFPKDFKYVGKTEVIKRRIGLHRSQAAKGKTKKDAWLRELKKEGIVVEYVVLEEMEDGTDHQTRERYWIEKVMNEHPCLNMRISASGCDSEAAKRRHRGEERLKKGKPNKMLTDEEYQVYLSLSGTHNERMQQMTSPCQHCGKIVTRVSKPRHERACIRPLTSTCQNCFKTMGTSYLRLQHPKRCNPK